MMSMMAAYSISTSEVLMTDEQQRRLERSAPVKAATVVEKAGPLRQPKRIIVFDNYKEIGAVPSGNKRRIQVNIGIKDGVVMLVMREFYLRRNEWKPGYNGMTVPVRLPINKATEIIEPLSDLIGLINNAVEISKDMPIADPEHTLYAK